MPAWRPYKSRRATHVFREVELTKPRLQRAASPVLHEKILTDDSQLLDRFSEAGMPSCYDGAESSIQTNQPTIRAIKTRRIILSRTCLAIITMTMRRNIGYTIVM